MCVIFQIPTDATEMIATTILYTCKQLKCVLFYKNDSAYHCAKNWTAKIPKVL